MSEVIWVVSTGEYSDYRVMCACPTKADANAVMKKYNESGDNWSDARVEQLPVVEASVEQIDVLTMEITIQDDDSLRDRGQRIRTEWPFDSLYPHSPVTWRWVRAPIHRGQAGRLEVSGTDHTRVRRVFSDKQAELLASPGLRLRREAKG